MQWQRPDTTQKPAACTAAACAQASVTKTHGADYDSPRLELAAALAGLTAACPQLARVRALAQRGWPPTGGRATPDLSSPKNLSQILFFQIFLDNII